MSKFTLDTAHSNIEFVVRHMMVSKVKGEFKKFDVNLTGDINDVSSLQFDVTIYPESIDTNQADRDNHLRTSDFFEIETYPEIKFVSTSVTDSTITGNLTIKDVTIEETFDFELTGTAQAPGGGLVAGGVVSGKIDRTKYGMNFNQALETGGVLVSDEVKFEANVEIGIEE
ncbi:MAG TPA: YceI family protein [Aliicoccus persicus]|uniref:YceI family protein n=1 Tax=Aliicoccus persicus TaxID=930138 RepID=A0A921JC90_9STAP|nr:YceI family protein [Aliicoccus persicus]